MVTQADEIKAKSIAMLFASFGQASDAERMAVYVEVLKDVSTNVLSVACKKAMMECKFLPSIAELIESAQNIVAEANGTQELPFAVVWEEILREIDRTYVWDKPKFSRKEIHQLVNAFGWQELKMMETKNIPTIRAQLSKMYDGICERNKEKRRNDYLLGNGELLLCDKTKLLK